MHHMGSTCPKSMVVASEAPPARGLNSKVSAEAWREGRRRRVMGMRAPGTRPRRHRLIPAAFFPGCCGIKSLDVAPGDRDHRVTGTRPEMREEGRNSTIREGLWRERRRETSA
jgi:hypothetical protein